ncbi:MAG: DoxX family membrane protein [Desulfovibrionales bacterium]
MAPGHTLHDRALLFLRLAIGLCYLWFGLLKLFPGQSPMEPLMRSAYDFLAQWNIMPLRLFILVIGIWEMLIGIGFFVGKYMNILAVLILLQLAGAFSPIVLAPEEVWKSFPFVLTLAGQYIIKDLVLLGAVFVLWSAARSRA